MAYFSTGSEGDAAVAEYCDRCVHGLCNLQCPVMALHLDWNYDAVGEDADETKKKALDTLWPRDGIWNGTCAMFIEKGKS